MRRSVMGLWLAPVLALVSYWGLGGGPQGIVAALFAAAATLWITEALHPAQTALLLLATTPLLGVATAKETFAAMGHPILFVFVGSFMLAEALRLHGLGERLARFLAKRATGQLSALVVGSLAAFLLSMWISNTAATAVVLPVMLALAGPVPDDDNPQAKQQHNRYRAALVLAVAWAASMGGLCTPVGTPPNLIGVAALRERGVEMDLVRWFTVGFPIAVVSLLALWVILAVVFRIKPNTPLQGATTALTRPWSRGEVAAAVALLLAIAGWTLPAVAAVLELPGAALLKSRLSEAVVAMLAAAVLFAWPIQKPGEPPRRALQWSEAVQIDWGTVLLFGSGILLGNLANQTGLATRFGDALLSGSGAVSNIAIVFLVTLVAVVLSEVVSNTAAATLVVPMAFAVAESAGTDPLAAVLGATFGASFGFMMPVSTAPNAMAYGTGTVSMRQMAGTGIVFDFFGLFVVVFGVVLMASFLR